MIDEIATQLHFALGLMWQSAVCKRVRFFLVPTYANEVMLFLIERKADPLKSDVRHSCE
jgi:hypothetical protein